MIYCKGGKILVSVKNKLHTLDPKGSARYFNTGKKIKANDEAGDSDKKRKIALKSILESFSKL